MFHRKLMSIAAVIGALVSGVVSAQTNDKAIELMSVAKVANGYVNKELHDEFWVEIKKSVAPDPTGAKLKGVEASLQEYILTSSAFPLEGWRSAKLSLEQKKVVRTQELVRQTNLLKAKGAPAIDSAIASTDMMLEAAATGKPLTRNGRTIYINDEMISQVLDGMDASLSRLEVLTNPVWSNEMQEQIIKPMGLTILSHEKFSVSRLKDMSAKSYQAGRNTGNIQEQIATISFTDNPNANLDQAVLKAYEGALASMGLKTKSQPTVWRGLKGLTAVAPFVMQGKANSMAIQVVKRPAEHSVLLVAALVEGAPADAALALDDLLQRIKLN